MSNNQDLIQSLEKTIAESHKNIRVLNAVKDVDNFIVVTIDGNSVTSTASDGMNVSNAVASLSTAIRSYAEKVGNSEDLHALLSIVNTEVVQISRLAQELEERENVAYEDEAQDPVDVVPLMEAPTRARPIAKGTPRK